MKHLALILAAAAVLSACATTSDDGEMTLAEGAKQECRMVEEPGSILKKRVCNNKATWAAIEEQDRENSKETIRDIQDRWTPVPKESGF